MTIPQPPGPSAPVLPATEWIRCPNGGGTNYQRPSTEDTAMTENVHDMNDESKQLVLAAEAVLEGIDPAVTALVPDAVAAVLRQLAALQRPGWEDGSEWPAPDDLELLATDITGGGE